MPAETSLRADPAHAGAILDAALDAVITIDHHGRVLEFNSAAERTFGYSKQEVLGRELAALIVPPAFRESHRRALERWTEHRAGAGRGCSSRPPDRGPGDALGRNRVPGRARDQPCRRSRAAGVHGLHPRHQRENRTRRSDCGPPSSATARSSSSFRSSRTSTTRPIRARRPCTSALRSRRCSATPPDEWLTLPDLFERAIHEDDRHRVLAEKVDAYARGATLRHEYRMHARDGRAHLGGGRVRARGAAGGRSALPAGVRTRHHGAQASRRCHSAGRDPLPDARRAATARRLHRSGRRHQLERLHEPSDRADARLLGRGVGR